MTQKIAVAIIHGAGTPKKSFAGKLINQISEQFSKQLFIQDAVDQLVFEPVYWSSIFADEQEKLWEKMHKSSELDFPLLRRFVIEFLGDAVAYQPTTLKNQNYDRVHALVAKSMNRLREKAGPNAPLCVISHSLGTVVASNYFYDLQYRRMNMGKKTIVCTSLNPLEQCETLTLFYTLGSPLALWSLRYMDYGSPVKVPATRMLEQYPHLQGEWLNFYDKDDVLAFPLKMVSEGYNKAVTKDVAVNAGGILTSWNPLSHNQYDVEKEVIQPIVKGLIKTWEAVN